MHQSVGNENDKEDELCLCPGVHRLHLAYAERSFPSENVMEVFASGLACGGD